MFFLNVTANKQKPSFLLWSSYHSNWQLYLEFLRAVILESSLKPFFPDVPHIVINKYINLAYKLTRVFCLSSVRLLPSCESHSCLDARYSSDWSYMFLFTVTCKLVMKQVHTCLKLSVFPSPVVFFPHDT